MKYIIDTNNFPLSDYTKWVHDNATPLTDCTDAISREEVIKASSKLCVSDECCKCQFDENTKCRLKSYRNYIRTLPSVNPTTEPFINKPCCISEKVCHEDKAETLNKIRAEIEKLKPNNPYFKGYFEQNVALNKALEVIDKYRARNDECWYEISNEFCAHDSKDQANVLNAIGTQFEIRSQDETRMATHIQLLEMAEQLNDNGKWFIETLYEYMKDMAKSEDKE